MRKITRIALMLVLSASTLNVVKAEDEIIKNEPVKNVEVVLSSFNEEGVLEPIAAPITTNSDGSFDLEIPESFPDYKPVFAVVQDPTGEGTQQISFVDMTAKGGVQIEPLDTAAAKTLITFMSETEDIDPASVPAELVKKFTDGITAVLASVPLPENSEDALKRYSDALSLRPDAFLDAVDGFNVNSEDMLKVAAMVGDAAAADFNPLAERPHLPDDIPPGLPTPGLIPPELMKKFTPKDFDFNKTFGDNIMPPGGLKGTVPPGSFMMPAGIALNPAVPFPNQPVLPQGVEVPKGFPMPPQAVMPPGMIIAEGFVPPVGFQIPQGTIAPANFNPEQFGAKFSTTFTPPAGFVPSPGFAVTDSQGGFGMPSGFPVPKGAAVPPTAMQFPAPAGFKAAPLPPGFEDSAKAGAQPFPANFIFPEGAVLPPTFSSGSFGTNANFVPPSNFVPKEFGSKADFTEFKGENFVAFDPNKGFNPADPFGGFRGPPLGADGQPVQGFLDPRVPPPTGVSFPQAPTDGTSFDPFAGFKPPQVGGPQGPANPPQNGGGNANPGGSPAPGGQPTPSNPPPNQPNGGGQSVPSAPPPAQPAPSAPTQPLAPPVVARTLDVVKQQKPKYLDARLHKPQARGITSQNMLAPLATGEVTNVILSAPDGTNALTTKRAKLTASEGVYLAGKVLSSPTALNVPVIIDPSTSKASVKLTVNIDNNVETTDIDVDADAVQLVTQLSGSTIQVSTTGTEIEFANTSVTGYLLPPGSSATGLKKALRMTGTVTTADGTSVVSFKKPAAAKTAGIYTVVFTDGEDHYFGKVTIGTLKARTLKGKVLAPKGKL